MRNSRSPFAVIYSAEKRVHLSSLFIYIQTLIA
jgi:hypothetical protein